MQHPLENARESANCLVETLNLETMDMQGIRKARRFPSEFRLKSFQSELKFNVPTVVQNIQLWVFGTGKKIILGW